MDTVSTTELIISVIVAVLGSSGLFAFIQFLVTRKDKKDDKISGLQKAVEDLKSTIEENDNKFHQAIDALTAQMEKSSVIQARIRILRSTDEIRKGVEHSYEYFRQLNQDITEYEQYCTANPNFKNNEAVNSIEYINKIYQSCLDSNNFLT